MATKLTLFLGLVIVVLVGNSRAKLASTVKRHSSTTTTNKSDDYLDAEDPFEHANKTKQGTVTSGPFVNRQTFMSPVVGAQVGLRTVMMSGVLYGLSLLPAMMVLLGGGGLGGALAAFGKRSIADGDPGNAWLPLLGKEKTGAFLHMLQDAFQKWGVANGSCKQLFVCEIYKEVASSGLSPELEVFQNAIDTVFKPKGTRYKRKADNVDYFYDAARVGVDHGNCSSVYPSCPHTLSSSFNLPTFEHNAFVTLGST